MTPLFRVLFFGLCLLATSAHAADDSPLFEAIEKGGKAEVAALLAKGADVNAKNSGGQTPLHWAAKFARQDIARLLLSNGADVNSRSTDGRTPLYTATLWNNTNIVELLLTKGADINAKNEEGRTPLHNATIQENRHIIELLLANGADVNARNKDGETPLHVAVERLNWDLVRSLIAHGADARVRNKFSHARPVQDGRLPINGGGETPADVAESGIGDPENRRVMVTFLEKAAIASWQQSGGSSPHHALQKLVKQLKSESRNQTLRKAILDLVPKLQPQPAVPPEAEHFEGRAKYMFKDAKSNSDMLDAAREYLKALEVAPWIANYYFDLCLILEQSNRPFEAQRACEFYLVAAPEAEDGSAVRMRIAGFGVQMERKQYRDEGRGIRKDEGLDWLATYNLYR